MPEIPSDHWLLNPSGDDIALVSLLHEWRRAYTVANETVDAGESSAGAVAEIERQIAEAPAHGAAGLAIKAWCAALNCRPVCDPALLSLIEHAPRFVPELAPFVAEILASAGQADRGEAAVPDDAEIVALFREWQIVNREAEESAGDRDDETLADFLDRLCAIEDRIAAAPAQGAAGMAVKALITAENDRPVYELSLLSLVALAPRFVPDSAPLAAAILAEHEAVMAMAYHEDEAAQAAGAEEELSRRVAALAAEFRDPKLPPGDAGLIEAERLRRELARHGVALDREFSITAELEAKLVNPVLQPLDDELWEFIRRRSPSGLPGVAVKLRLLREEEGSDDDAGLGKCVAVIERELARAAGA